MALFSFIGRFIAQGHHDKLWASSGANATSTFLRRCVQLCLSALNHDRATCHSALSLAAPVSWRSVACVSACAIPFADSAAVSSRMFTLSPSP
jgi:hypothetical protein